MRKPLKCCVEKIDRLFYIYICIAVSHSCSCQAVIPSLNFSNTHMGIGGWLNKNALGGISLCPFFFHSPSNA